MGEREIIYLSLHCHHQNNFCIKVGSDESHFKVSLIVRDKVTRQCPQTQLLKRKESRSGFEPRSLCLPAQRLTTRPNRLTIMLLLLVAFIYSASLRSRSDSLRSCRMWFYMSDWLFFLVSTEVMFLHRCYMAGAT